MDEVLRRAEAARQSAQEDAVHYEVFCVGDDIPSGWPRRSDFGDVPSFLDSLAVACVSALSDCIADYIWHKDPFRLSVRSARGVGDRDEDDDDRGVERLRGVTRFGDNIEDEWFIVHLLLELTRRNPSLVARVWDADGEFLLIEAADLLPGWLDPEASVNRVYVAGGHVHLLALPEGPADIPLLPVGRPTLRQGLHAVATRPDRTRAMPAIENAIIARIGSASKRRALQNHFANCRLPRAAALLLRSYPQAIAPAAEMFYLRDPVSFRACRDMRRAVPAGSAFVRARVRFTRAIYAMLKCQKFVAPPVFGRPPPVSTPAHAEWEMGAKVTCGLEMLLDDAERRRAARGVAACADNDPLARACAHPLWRRYVDALRARGYFRDEMEGSRLHRQLMATAAAEFVSAYIEGGDKGDGAGVPQSPGDIGARKDASMEGADGVADMYRAVVEQLSSGGEAHEWDDNLPPSDSDAWMELTEDELEAMAAERSGIVRGAQTERNEGRARTKGDGGDVEEVRFDLENVAERMKAFLGRVSSHKGAVADVDGQADSDDDDAPAQSRAAAKGQPKGDGPSVSFDAKAFVRTLKGVLDMQGSGSDSDSDDADGLGDDLFGDDDDLSEFGFGDSDTSEDEGGKGSRGVEDVEARLQRGMRKISALARAMDAELAEKSATLGDSFARAAPPESEGSARVDARGGKGKEKEREGPAAQTDPRAPMDGVDIDVNLLKNVLDSFAAQHGMAGPVSNLLGSLGIRLPDETHAAAK